MIKISYILVVTMNHRIILGVSSDEKKERIKTIPADKALIIG